jgi:pseudouridine synthase
LIEQGKVAVNGVVITEMGQKIDPEADLVTIDGKPVQAQAEFLYIILHKPAGYLTTVSDPFNRPTVMGLLPEAYNRERIYPVGRLDLDTTGLLFFTNDGDLALALAHPRHLVEKIYLAHVRGVPASAELKRLAEGIRLDDGPTAPAKVRLESVENGNAIIKIGIREGRNRQVKRMMVAIGHPVITLHRLAMGPLNLEGLKPGEFRKLSPQELQELLRLKEQLKRVES